MTGVRKFIQDNLPPSWDKVLRNNKCLGSFVNQFYNAIVKQKNKNKYHYNVTIMNARHHLKCYSIGTIAVGFGFKEGTEFWNRIDYQVKQYELMYK